jgi:hypothetical protein
VFVVTDVKYLHEVGLLAVAATYAAGCDLVRVISRSLTVVRVVVRCWLMASLYACVVASLGVVLTIVVVAVDELTAVTLDDRLVNDLVQTTRVLLALTITLGRQFLVVLRLCAFVYICHHNFDGLEIFSTCSAPFYKRVILAFQESITFLQLVIDQGQSTVLDLDFT